MRVGGISSFALMGTPAHLDCPFTHARKPKLLLSAVPEMRCALAAAQQTAPAAFAPIYLHVVWREQMAIAADPWYRAGIRCNPSAGATFGEAAHFGFGASKHAPATICPWVC
jgi:hypothetical protein